MTQTTPRLAAIAVGLSMIAAPALAAAPPPAKPVPASFFSGAWHEIARTPNMNQKDCEAPVSKFVSGAGGAYTVSQTCRKGSPTGPAKTVSTKGAIVPGTNNAKFSMSFLGGIKKQEYWILDRADDNGWAIMATPGGNYVWLLSRNAQMPAATRNAALARIKALGYDTAKLVFPKQ